MSESPLLIPPPRLLRLMGGVVSMPSEWTIAGAGAWPEVEQLGARRIDDAGRAHIVVQMTGEMVDERSTRGQWHRLTIAPRDNGSACFARIEAHAGIGGRYALRTLVQIVRWARRSPPPLGRGGASGGRDERALPGMIIEDEPSFALRGVMLDISRDRVPTMEMLFEIVNHLAALKINHLQLYMEHTFAYAGHEQVWRDASPMTPDEIRTLDTYAGKHGIELAANQNCFGHLTRWLAHPRYAPLAETHGDWVFDNGQVRVPRSGPFSLCPIDPRSLELVDDWLRQLLPCFRSPRVNIGCDETFDVGTGRSRAAVERHGRAAVYAEYVNAVAAIARQHGGIPMFWADIALREPRALDLLDVDLTALVWGYEPDAPFEQWCRAIRQAASGSARAVWMCPGTSAWRSITGRTSERRGNLIAAARAGLAHGAAGYLITEWGDHGHRQQWPITLHALADGASVAWNADAADRFDARAASFHLMGDASGLVGPWLEELGDLDGPLRGAWEMVQGPGPPPERVLNATALYSDIHEPLSVEPHFGGDASQWRFLKSRLSTLLADVPRFPTELVHDEIWLTLNVCRFGIMRGLLRRGDRSIAPKDLARFMRQIIDEHRRLWLERSRIGGLDDSCRYYQRIAEELEQ